MKMKTFQSTIIERMMTAEEYSKFLEKYMSIRQAGRGMNPRPVSDNDRAILSDYKAKVAMKDLMAKYNLSKGKVETAILKAAQE